MNEFRIISKKVFFRNLKVAHGKAEDDKLERTHEKTHTRRHTREDTHEKAHTRSIETKTTRKQNKAIEKKPKRTGTRRGPIETKITKENGEQGGPTEQRKQN